jgi:rhodanese-related sulfurtransferase
VQELEPAEVARRLAEGWQLVDVRTPEERGAAAIAGSTHVELDELTARADTIDRDRPVVFYCRVGARSGLAADAFRASGYDAYNLRGGIEAWIEAGLPVADG